VPDIKAAEDLDLRPVQILHWSVSAKLPLVFLLLDAS
jgi:hypothetical protein